MMELPRLTRRLSGALVSFSSGLAAARWTEGLAEKQKEREKGQASKTAAQEKACETTTEKEDLTRRERGQYVKKKLDLKS